MSLPPSSTLTLCSPHLSTCRSWAAWLPCPFSFGNYTYEGPLLLFSSLFSWQTPVDSFGLHQLSLILGSLPSPWVRCTLQVLTIAVYTSLAALTVLNLSSDFSVCHPHLPNNTGCPPRSEGAVFSSVLPIAKHRSWHIAVTSVCLLNEWIKVFAVRGNANLTVSKVCIFHQGQTSLDVRFLICKRGGCVGHCLKSLSAPTVWHLWF